MLKESHKRQRSPPAPVTANVCVATPAVVLASECSDDGACREPEHKSVAASTATLQHDVAVETYVCTGVLDMLSVPTPQDSRC